MMDDAQSNRKREPLMNAKELGELLGLKRPAIYLMVKHGQIPAVMIGRRIRFDRKAIAAWIDAGGTASKGAT